jgi:hypothetical protein
MLRDLQKQLESCAGPKSDQDPCRRKTNRDRIRAQGACRQQVLGGGAIDPNNKERIFDTFFTKSDGMGVGLAHGGRLWPSPGAPYGSVFHVLPSSE